MHLRHITGSHAGRQYIFRSLLLIVAGSLRSTVAADPSPIYVQAVIDKIDSKTYGALAAQAHGTIKVDGKSYEFLSGGFGHGYLPLGNYTVTNPTLTKQPGMYVPPVGFKFFISDKLDPRLKQYFSDSSDQMRTELRIHPDQPPPGTHGCMGIHGTTQELQQFYKDLSNEVNSGQTVIVVVSYKPNAS